MHFEKLSPHTLCGFGTAAVLDQNVKDEAVQIEGAPKPVFIPCNRDDHLVEVLFVTNLADRSFPDDIYKMPAESLNPKSLRLVSDDEATRRQYILNNAQTERKPETKPNGISNNASWKAVPTIKKSTGKSGHAARSKITQFDLSPVEVKVR